MTTKAIVPSSSAEAAARQIIVSPTGKLAAHTPHQLQYHKQQAIKKN